MRINTESKIRSQDSRVTEVQSPDCTLYQLRAHQDSGGAKLLRSWNSEAGWHGNGIGSHLILCPLISCFSLKKKKTNPGVWSEV